MRLVDIFYENINGDIFYKDIKGDLFLKDIKGQSADIKGNLNVIGHLMMLSVDDVAVPFVSGYFEIDGSMVINAKKNYPALFNLLRADVPQIDNIADLRDNNIELGARAGLLKSQGRESTIIGRHTPVQQVAHNHRYYYNDGGNGEHMKTENTNTVTDLPNYIMRLFIYHGVHV